MPGSVYFESVETAGSGSSAVFYRSYSLSITTGETLPRWEGAQRVGFMAMGLTTHLSSPCHLSLATELLTSFMTTRGKAM